MPELEIPKDDRIVCFVKIRPYNSPIMNSYEFKIDTGADFSTISKSALYDLGFTDEWIEKNKKPSKGSTSVATGENVESYDIHLPYINIYGAKGFNYPFGILLDKKEDLPKPTCTGCKHTVAKKLDYRLLLGKDILSCFNITIDREKNILHIDRLSTLDERNAKYPDRQLNFVESDLDNQ